MSVLVCGRCVSYKHPMGLIILKNPNVSILSVYKIKLHFDFLNLLLLFIMLYFLVWAWVNCHSFEYPCYGSVSAANFCLLRTIIAKLDQLTASFNSAIFFIIFILFEINCEVCVKHSQYDCEIAIFPVAAPIIILTIPNPFVV